MATLQFKGKSAVWNHHLAVPYHTLDKDKEKSRKGDDASENLIIEGDNLLALKSLLPKYQGRVNCIYIDPPYNTGKENWVYNDKVNNPIIKDWLGSVVAKDDLTKHDKWLCMMTPRLKLLRELLSDEGVIFISIDDNELHNLKALIEEIFGQNRFLGMITWINRTKPKNMGKAKYALQQNTEYILCYSRCHKDNFNGFILPETYKKRYPYKKDGNEYRLEEIQQRKNLGSMRRNSMVYELLGITPKEDYRWQLSPESRDKLIEQNKLIKERTKIYEIIFKKDEEDSAFEPFWSHREDAGTAESAKESLEQLLECDEVFDNVKPVELLKQLFTFLPEDALFLDSFAGSGTTAQAILELNKESGKRKFILVQIPEKIDKDAPAYKAGFKWVHEITRERVSKVIKNYKIESGFTYYTLGPSIDEVSILAGILPKYNDFAKYVFYLATGKNHPDDKKIIEKYFFVGKTSNESIYLLYDQDLDSLKKLSITLDWAEKIQKKDPGKKIIYAPACFLDEEYLDKFNIKFVSIPYNLFEKK